MHYLTSWILKLAALLAALLVFSVTAAYAEIDLERGGFHNGDLRAHFSENSHREFAVEVTFRRPVKDSRWWVSQKFWGLSVVFEDTVGTASMQGAVNIVTSYLSGVVSGHSPFSKVNANSPLYVALALPSSQLEYELTDRVFIGLSNNTEYLFARGHGGERGIYYTPALTLSAWRFVFAEISDSYCAQLVIGRTFFWNFEGHNRSTGWTIGLMLRFGYQFH